MDAADYPIARWYLRPAGAYLAAVLCPTWVRPVHLTLLGLAAAAGAAGVLLWQPRFGPIAAALLLLYGLMDRADGLLARRQRTASAWGAWLDGNVDELVDVGLHVVTAAVVASEAAAPWPWWLLSTFLAGKYLVMYGLALEERPAPLPQAGEGSLDARHRALLRRMYHLPGNADVRLHLLVLALASGYLAAELALVAVYYNLRWVARYVLVARRLGGPR